MLESARPDPVDNQPHHASVAPHASLSSAGAPSHERKSSTDVYHPSNPLPLHVAQEISAMFTALYHCYPDQTIAHPALICNEVAQGNWIAFVAKSDSGRVIGHAALLNNGDGVFDSGRVVVSKEAQGGGVARKLVEESLRYAEGSSSPSIFDGVKAEAVTSHTRSQAIYHKLDFAPTGLHLSKFTEFYQGMQEREAVLLVTKIVDRSLLLEREVYVPERYKYVAEHIYKSLGCDRKLTSVSATDAALPEKPVLKINTHDLIGFEAVYVQSNAAVETGELLKTARDQLSGGAKFIEIKLDASHPVTLQQALALRSEGFLFAGIEVLKDRDLLVLQKLQAARQEALKGVQLLDPRANAMLDLIKQAEADLC